MLVPEKLDLESLNVTDGRIRELLRLFPEAASEDGTINFDRLKLSMGTAVDVGKERYGLVWPGKAECFRAMQTPTTATLLPLPSKALNPVNAANVIIEGDNLEVLKLLQKPYLNRIKTIYIDPPYNTGSDFIYPDDYSESLQTYLKYTGQADAEGRKFGNNPESDGRFHSKWLNMMYPRLLLARDLLRKDGLIFVSIDDNEVHNLRALMNEVFGEENRIESFVWKKSYGGGAKEKFAVTQHEYILLYAKSKDDIGELWLPPDAEAEKKYYKYKDEKFEKRGPYRIKPLEATKSMDERENLVFGIPAPDGSEVWPKKQWWWSEERVLEAIANNDLVFAKNDDGYTISYKQYLRDEDGVERGAKPFSVMEGPYTQTGTSDLARWFDGSSPMQFPKPVDLIKRMISIGDTGTTDGIVLDFFAGSGTTGEAVLDLNRQDGGTRQFVLVQLPEKTNNETYPTIADITEHRIKRVIESGSKDPELPLKHPEGFAVFALAESNIKLWDPSVPHEVTAVEQQLALNVRHLREGRTDADLFYEIVLKSGYPLSTPFQKVETLGSVVFSIDSGEFLICLERKIALELVRAIAAMKPKRVVLLDDGFAGSDQLKANAVQTFRTQGVDSFRTL